MVSHIGDSSNTTAMPQLSAVLHLYRILLVSIVHRWGWGGSASSGLWEGWLLPVIDPSHTMRSATSGCIECQAYWNSHVSCILNCFGIPFIWILGAWTSADGIIRGHSGVIEPRIHQEWHRSLHVFRRGPIDPSSQKYSNENWNSCVMFRGQNLCV